MTRIATLCLVAGSLAACASRSGSQDFNLQQSEPGIVKSYAADRYIAVQLAALPDVPVSDVGSQ